MSGASGVMELDLDLEIEVPKEDTPPPAATSGRSRGAKAEKAERPSKAKQQPDLTVPARCQAVSGVDVSDRTEEIWKDLRLEVKDGFYEILGERGVVGLIDLPSGKQEVRVPFAAIKGLFRVQWVTDMQVVDHPIILATRWWVFYDGAHAFVEIGETQFNTLDVMLAKSVGRSYSYHDMADGKRGYTLSHPDFPSTLELERFRSKTAPSGVRRKVEVAEEPSAAAPAAEVV